MLYIIDIDDCACVIRSLCRNSKEGCESVLGIGDCSGLRIQTALSFQRKVKKTVPVCFPTRM